MIAAVDILTESRQLLLLCTIAFIVLGIIILSSRELGWVFERVQNWFAGLFKR